MSLLPYSPIGGGMLSGKYNADKIPEHSRFGEYLQLENPRQRAMADRFLNKGTLDSTARYIEIAREAGMSPTTLAVAWSMNFDFVASTIIGARTADQLDESFAALDVKRYSSSCVPHQASKRAFLRHGQFFRFLIQQIEDQSLKQIIEIVKVRSADNPHARRF